MSQSSETRVPWTSVLVDNAKMLVMYGLGMAIIATVGWPLSLAYLAYCLLSLLAFIRLICPYCFRYRLGTCLSGYHSFARWFKPQDVKKFPTQFKRYIALLFPVWFLPPLIGGYRLFTHFSWLLVIQLGLFCLVAFVILPYISGQHSCKTCENAENCPWRKDK